MFVISKSYDPFILSFWTFNVILLPLISAFNLSLSVPVTVTPFASYPVPWAFSPFVILSINSPINLLYPSGDSISSNNIVSDVFMLLILIVPQFTVPDVVITSCSASLFTFTLNFAVPFVIVFPNSSVFTISSS